MAQVVLHKGWSARGSHPSAAARGKRAKDRRGFAPVLAALALSLPFSAFHGPASAETLLERGAYLEKSLVACGNCHTPKLRDLPNQDMEMAGGFQMVREAWTANSANITPDKETGIGNWTDAQVIRATREGVLPDGSIIGPPMPIEFYRHMSDRDAKAFVAYLRSLKPVRNKVPRSVYRVPPPKSYGPPLGEVPDVPREDKVRYGEYLVRIARCMDCHTPMIKGVRDMENQMGAGGFPFDGPWGRVFSPNITPDKETGIGGWTDRQIKVAISLGMMPDGRKMLRPMPTPYYVNLKRGDLEAIVAYLRTIKLVRKKLKVRYIPPKKR